MKSRIIFLFSVLTAVLIYGCTSPATIESGEKAVSTSIPIPPNQNIQKSAMILNTDLNELYLNLNDFSDSMFVLQQKENLSKPDKRESGQGWINGVEISFLKTEKKDGGYITQVKQVISRYESGTLESVLQNVQDIKTRTITQLSPNNEQISIELLPNPNIGEKSVSYLTITNIHEIPQLKVYEIFFYKKDVFEKIAMVGTDTNYDVLMDLAKKAEIKMR